MSEFAVGSPFARNIAKEIMVLLLSLGLDINYINKHGFTPLQESVRGKLKNL